MHNLIMYISIAEYRDYTVDLLHPIPDSDASGSEKKPGRKPFLWGTKKKLPLKMKMKPGAEEAQ